mmetsp:Transcript_14013/g.33994  ORF Transcript_14013/g.33994 Transcript_14013/m.33994 type:complete len:307 (-) Transcript_14013:147-1067(-)
MAPATRAPTRVRARLSWITMASLSVSGRDEAQVKRPPDISAKVGGLVRIKIAAPCIPAACLGACACGRTGRTCRVSSARWAPRAACAPAPGDGDPPESGAGRATASASAAAASPRWAPRRGLRVSADAATSASETAASASATASAATAPAWDAAVPAAVSASSIATAAASSARAAAVAASEAAANTASAAAAPTLCSALLTAASTCPGEGTDSEPVSTAAPVAATSFPSISPCTTAFSFAAVSAALSPCSAPAELPTRCCGKYVASLLRPPPMAASAVYLAVLGVRAPAPAAESVSPPWAALPPPA